MSTAAPRADAPLSGIGYALLGVSVFSFQDVIVKLLSGDYPMFEIMFVRGVVGLPLNLLLVLWLDGGLHTLRSTRPWLMSLRSLLIILAFTCYYMAIATLAIADLAAIFFVAPLMMTAMAALLLREPVGVHRWAAVVVGFVGVLVMMRPGAGAFEPAALLGLAAAFCYASAQITTRELGRSDSAAAIAFYATALYTLVSGLDGLLFGRVELAPDTHASIAFLLRAWVMPTWGDFALMSLCAPIATLGIYSLVQAYRVAPPAVVAPFEYVMLLWAIVNGYLFFGDLAGMHTFAGMALVAGAGLYVLLREARAKRAREAALSSRPTARSVDAGR